MDNVTKLREVCRVWDESKGANKEQWIDLMAEDVVFGSLAGGAPSVEFTAESMGREQVMRYLTALIADWDMKYFRMEEFLIDGDRVAIRGNIAYTNRRTGKSFESPLAQFVQFRGGKIIEFFEFYDTAKVLAAARPD